MVVWIKTLPRNTHFRGESLLCSRGSELCSPAWTFLCFITLPTPISSQPCSYTAAVNMMRTAKKTWNAYDLQCLTFVSFGTYGSWEQADTCLKCSRSIGLVLSVALNIKNSWGWWENFTVNPDLTPHALLKPIHPSLCLHQLISIEHPCRRSVLQLHHAGMRFRASRF